MNKKTSRIGGCCFLVLVSIFLCAPGSAQYRDRLGGNWNNPASSMITNIILDRMARRRLAKRLGVKTPGSGSAAVTRAPRVSAAPAALSDAPVRFRSTGTQLKTREIATALGGTPEETAQVATLLRAILVEYDKEARKLGKPNDLALALAFFFSTNPSVYHETPEPADALVMELRDTFASALVEGGALNGVTDRQKQEMYEALVLYTGLALSGYQAAKEAGDAENLKVYKQLAGLNLQAVTGISPDKITFGDQGLNIERDAEEAP